MLKGKHVTFGGLGQHEFYMPTTGRGNKNRRDRKKCKFYHVETKWCTKIRNLCVGPTLCMKYREEADAGKKHTKREFDIGTIVYSKRRGQGRIVTISEDICTIQFSTGKKITAKYPDAFKNGQYTTEPHK